LKTKGGTAEKSTKRAKRPEVLENSWVEAGGWKQKTELGRVVGVHPRAMRMVIKIKGLRGKQFVRI